MDDIVNFEKIIISGLMKSKVCNIMALQKIDKSFITSPELRNLYVIFSDYYLKFGGILKSKSALLDCFKSRNLDADQYFLIAKQIKSLDFSDADFKYALDKVRDEYLFRNTAIILSDTVSQLKESGSKDIKASIKKLQERIYNLQLSGKCLIHKRTEISKDIVEDLNLYLEKEKKPILTGINSIDNITGGFQRGELVVLMALTGHGKSIMLLNFAHNAYLAGYNVVYITIEIPERQLRRRLNSLVSQIDYKKFRNKTLTVEEWKIYIRNKIKFFLDPSEYERFDILWEKYKRNITSINQSDIEKIYQQLIIQPKLKVRENNFYCIDIPKGCNIVTIETEIGQLAEACDLLVVDYLGIMTPMTKTGQIWERYGEITKDLKELARDWDIPVFTACQMREVKKGETISTENTKYARAISEHADYILGWQNTPDDDINDRIRLSIVKGRDIERDNVILYRNFNKMYIGDYK